MNRLTGNKYINLLNVSVLLLGFFALNFPAEAQNKLPIDKYKIREKFFQYKLGDRTVKIVVSKTSQRLSRVVYFNMHDNENTSVEAGKAILKKYGGTLLELENGDKKLVNFSLKDKQFTFDPNRIFTKVGIKKTLEKNGEYTIEAEDETDKFAGKLKDLLKNARLIIALHNNSDGNYSIKSYIKGGEYEGDAKIVNINADNDTDDFFFVTENNFFKFLTEKNQNVALQDNANVTDDGSLSVYCGYHKISYINVEAETGHLTQQTKMLEILQEIISEVNRGKKKNRRR